MSKESSKKKLKAVEAQEARKIKTQLTSTSATDSKVPNHRSIMKQVPESSLPKRLTLSLTREEIIEDLEAMTQTRHVRSRHKRNPTVQKQIDKLCPMVSEAVFKPELYEVSEDDDEESSDEEKEEEKDSFCGLCGKMYTSDKFWIGCDFCEMWFHGSCVKITSAKAKHIKKYKCPACAKKNAHSSA